MSWNFQQVACKGWEHESVRVREQCVGIPTKFDCKTFKQISESVY